ncbi:hypothetical protein CEXT_404681 [Caerostris extrusa]|uniref:Uncharacterized protein n=1 Tax=Caerostris extrusa TaxID=172846 RepID=A0AAV4TBH2_CAEEX|nr:hypothetical protein CEXT_404681 [Caerostris extrusa]
MDGGGGWEGTSYPLPSPDHSNIGKNYNVAPILQEHWKELQCLPHSTRTLERSTMSPPFYKNIGKNYNVTPIVK